MITGNLKVNNFDDDDDDDDDDDGDDELFCRMGDRRKYIEPYFQPGLFSFKVNSKKTRKMRETYQQ